MIKKSEVAVVKVGQLCTMEVKGKPVSGHVYKDKEDCYIAHIARLMNNIEKASNALSIDWS